MAHIKKTKKISTKLLTQNCLVKQKDISTYKFLLKITKKTFVEVAFYYSNFHELLFSLSIASNFYTSSFEEVINRSLKLVNKSKVNKRAFYLDCL